MRRPRFHVIDTYLFFLPSQKFVNLKKRKVRDTSIVYERKKEFLERSIVYPYYWIGVIISSPSVCNWILKWSKRILSALLSFFSRFNYQETSKEKIMHKDERYFLHFSQLSGSIPGKTRCSGDIVNCFKNSSLSLEIFLKFVRFLRSQIYF